MKIGNCVQFRDSEKVIKGLEVLHQYGFDNCQLVAWNPSLWTDEMAERILETVRKYHITISGFWCGWSGPSVWNFYDGQITLGLVPPEYRAQRIADLCAGSDFAKKLGVTDVITHMGFIPENPNDPLFAGFCVAVRTVAEHCKKNGQYLLFETGQETPVTMLRCFEQVGCDNLGVNLDTANLILYGRANPVDALDVFGQYVRNIHAKDGCYPTNGHDLGRETALGEGKVDFRALFVKLKELGYDSYVTIERELFNEQEITDVLAGREYLQNIIKEVYGG